jgi:Invasion associated locus B (IalB) protein
MARFGENKRNKLATKSLRWACGAFAAAIVAVAMVPAASAQTASMADTWMTDCEGANCVTYFMTAGMQVFIGQEEGGERLLAEFRVLPTSIPGTPVGLRLDSGWGGGMVVNECNDTYCNFILDLSADPTLIDQFKGAGSGMLAYVITDGTQIVMVPFHLNGFTAAYNQRTGG